MWREGRGPEGHLWQYSRTGHEPEPCIPHDINETHSCAQNNITRLECLRTQLLMERLSSTVLTSFPSFPIS